MQEFRKLHCSIPLIVFVLLLSGCVQGPPLVANLRGFVGIPISIAGLSLEDLDGTINPADLVVSSAPLNSQEFYPLAGARVRISGEVDVWETKSDGSFYAYDLKTGYKTIKISHRALRSDLEETVKISVGNNTWSFLGGVGYYLIVGIERYHYLEDAPGATLDADGVYQVFDEHTRLPGYTALLKNHQATKNNIKNAILEAANLALAQDYFVLYFAGHTGQDYLCPYDSDGYNWSTEVTDKELESWLRSFPGYVTVILDGAESATFADGEIHPFALKKRNYTVISSAGKSQEANAFEGGHGLFTHYLIAGLSTPEERWKADSNRDGTITAYEIFDYIKYGMFQWAGNAQIPELYVGSLENTVILRY